MTLRLSMLRTPGGVAPDSKLFDAGTVVLGRGSASDWVLADPERLLSKRHCAIMADDGVWRIVDSSSNGTFLNGRCLDPGTPMPLRHGDRLGLAAYEIEIGIEEGLADPYGRVTADPFPLEATQSGAIGLPHDFNALGQDGLFGDAPAADDAPALAGHFAAPRPQADLLPADWDAENDAPPAAVPAREARADCLPTQLAAPPVHAAVAAAAPSAAAFPPPALGGTTPHLGAPEPGASGGAPADQGNLAAALTLVAQAAGIEGTPRAAPADALAALGRAFRALAVGLRRTMIARATVKGGFRIEQTMIQPTGNNPLKFSAGDDDALSALLGIGRDTGMTAAQAVADALRDIRVHDLAVTAAMQRAARAMLDRLHPARAAEELPMSVLDRIPGNRARRAFAAAVARHEKIAQAFSDDFDSVFGRAFVRAYEQAQAELAAQEEGAAPHREPMP